DGILSNLRELCRRGHTVVVRVPLIAGVNDDPADLGRLGAFVAGLAGPPRVDLLPGHRIGADKYARLDRTARLAAPSPPPERLAQAQELLHGLGLAVSVGG
ncbi:MAG TPA: hypothetical protein VMS93_04340, partial [Candidatus Saccharimonadales bacterium]|nr:hypothetical protein [Candidatus Saccharimonadales bacterium]